MSEVDIGLPTFNVGEVASSAGSALVNVLLWLLIIFLIVAVLFGIFYFMSFKHRVRVKKSVRGRVIVIDDKARVLKNGEWLLLRTKIKVCAPPDEAIDINKKGKYICEGVLLEDNRFVWRIDEFDAEKFKGQEEKDLISFKSNNRHFSSSERSALAQEVVEAQQYRKKKLLDILGAVAPYLAIIIIFVLFLVFFDNVVTPAVELGKSIQASHQLQLETMKIMQNILQNKEDMMLNIVVPN